MTVVLRFQHSCSQTAILNPSRSLNCTMRDTRRSTSEYFGGEEQRQHVVAGDLDWSRRPGLLETVGDTALQGAVGLVDALDLPYRTETRLPGPGGLEAKP